MRKLFIILLFGIFILAAAAQQVVALDGTLVVLSFEGNVKVVPAGEENPVYCKPGMVLKEGVRIITGPESYIKLAFGRSERNIVKIRENSEVAIKLDSADKIELIDGEVFTMLKGLKKGETFRVRTPAATCGARGTGWSTKIRDKVAHVTVFDGSVFVRGINKDGSVMEKEFWIKKGFERRIKRFENPERSVRVSQARLASMEKEIRHTAKMGGSAEKEQLVGGPLPVTPREVDGVKERKESSKVTEKRDKISRKVEKVVNRRKKMEKNTDKIVAIRGMRKEGALARKNDKHIRKVRKIKKDGSKRVVIINEQVN